jgi:glucose-6-phosphate isomerase
MTTYPDFDKVPAYQTLSKLSKLPFDLTGSGALTPERISNYICSASCFDFLYAARRVDEPILDALQKLADECRVVEQFIDMKQGQVMNRIEGFKSENRQVLHASTRDVFSGSPANPEATEQAGVELEKLKLFLQELESGKIKTPAGKPFKAMIQIGIGGSDLGPRALYLALAAYRLKDRKAYFISNVDPDDAAAVLEGLDLSTTLVNIVSKSGTTLETLTNEELVREAYLKAGLDPEKYFIAVTGQGSPMDNPEKYLRTFYMFDYIGGRFSSTSMVGAVMLGFALGYEQMCEILKGAYSMDVIGEETDIRKNMPLLIALLGVWNHNFLGSETVAILPYSQALIRFSAHLQQLDMESNGKSISRQGNKISYKTGPIVWGEPGTNGQHAFYQLIHQGTTIVPVEFIGFRNNQYEYDLMVKGTTSQDKILANLLAQSMAMAMGKENVNPNCSFSGNRPNSILISDRLTPFSMGALLALYEAKIVFQGFIWNINSFDQEGVQLGKILANQLLEHISEIKEVENPDTGKDELGWAMLRAAGIYGNNDRTKK